MASQRVSRAEHHRLSTYQGDEDIYRALGVAAVTYLLKDMVAEDMMVAIREVPRIGPGNLAAAEEIAAELNIGDETA